MDRNCQTPMFPSKVNLLNSQNTCIGNETNKKTQLLVMVVEHLSFEMKMIHFKHFILNDNGLVIDTMRILFRSHPKL